MWRRGETPAALARVGHRLDREAQDVVVAREELQSPRRRLRSRRGPCTLSSVILAPARGQVLDRPELHVHQVPAVQPTLVCGSKRVQREDDVDAQLGQLRGRARSSARRRPLEFIVIAADLGPPAQPEQIEQVAGAASARRR